MKGSRIVIAVFEGCQALDVVGPLEVFASATALGGARYDITVAAPGGGPITTSSGLVVSTGGDLRRIRGPIDTLVIAGGAGTREAMSDTRTVAAIGRLATRARRVTSVCTGAFLLAAAGVLDGRRATTHWAWCETLASLFPAIEVSPDSIFVRDGDVWTSAGVTAGMDLALALVEEDGGRDVAMSVARQLVMFVRRPGGQSQFSAQLAGQIAERDALRELQAWILDNVAADLCVPALAARVSMSPRNFARVFRREVGVTPAQFAERARVEAARRLLEDTSLGQTDVAGRCGFATADVFRRAFARQLGVSPSSYRARFSTTTSSAASSASDSP